MDGEVYDFNRICRSCRTESSEMQSLFDDHEYSILNPRIDEMLMACTTLQVSNGDGLPNLMCQKCVEDLNQAYRFKKQAEDTDIFLRKYIVKQELVLQNVEIELEEGQDNSVLPQNDTSERKNNRNTNGENLVYNDTPMVKDFIELLDENQMLLTCRTCDKSFTTLDGLKCHKRIHTGGLFACKECGKKYTRQNHLQRHELSHGRRKLHVCKICNKTLTGFEHLKRHLTTHLKDKPFACRLCHRGFNKSESLATHESKCKGDRIHICDICNKGFSREDSLEVHKKTHENTMPTMPTIDNLDNIDEHYFVIDFGEKSALSDLSDSDNNDNSDNFFEPHVFVEELEKHTSDVSAVSEKEDAQNESNAERNIDQVELLLDQNVCKEENGSVGSEELLNENNLLDEVADENQFEVVENDQIDGDCDSDSGQSEFLPSRPIVKGKRKRGRPRKHFPANKSTRPRGRPAKIKKEEDETGDFSCLTCSKSFTKLSHYENHIVKHQGFRVYPCTLCSKKFTRTSHLKRHLISHTKDKPFACETCPKSFSRRDHLIQHRKLHERQHDFECEVCQRRFNRLDQLAKHKASKHNIGEKVVTEKKYQCDICLKAFTTEKYRDVHLKGHLGQNKYQCKTCDKSFISKSHLNEHLKFHNDNSKKFLCSECGQRFIRNDYLIIHMRRHRGEKPFKCKFCGKGFPRTTDLTVHERYHTGEKTHLCTVCGRGFGRAYNLTVHMRTHTGEKPYQCTYCEAAFAQGNDLKAHVRRHTGERFQCELCSENFLMGYLLTHHKRTVHGLNIVSHIRRLNPVNKVEAFIPEEPPVIVQLPAPVIPVPVYNTQLQVDQMQPVPGSSV